MVSTAYFWTQWIQFFQGLFVSTGITFLPDFLVGKVLWFSAWRCYQFLEHWYIDSQPPILEYCIMYMFNFFNFWFSNIVQLRKQYNSINQSINHQIFFSVDWINLKLKSNPNPQLFAIEHGAPFLCLSDVLSLKQAMLNIFDKFWFDLTVWRN